MSRLTHGERKRLGTTAISHEPGRYKPHTFVELLGGASTKLRIEVSDLDRDLLSFESSFCKLAATLQLFVGRSNEQPEHLPDALSKFDTDLSDRLWDWCFGQEEFVEAWKPFVNRPGKIELKHFPPYDPEFRVGQRTDRELAFLFAACQGMWAAIVRKTSRTTPKHLREAARKFLESLEKEGYEKKDFRWIVDLSSRERRPDHRRGLLYWLAAGSAVNRPPLNYPKQWSDAHVLVNEFSEALLQFHRFSTKKGNPFVSSINKFLSFCGESEQDQSQIRKWLSDARH